MSPDARSTPMAGLGRRRMGWGRHPAGRAAQVGRVYTFLPMEEPSPLAAHVHAPFFTKLARREFGLDVPLNTF